MELPFKVIVVVALVAFVLTTFYVFFSSTTGEQISQAEANRVFYSICDEYKRSNCDWNVRSRGNFGEFMKACQALFTQDSGEYSCLYEQCCQETENVLCSGFCHACRGNDLAGVGQELCCARYRADCSGEICNAC